MKGFMTFLFILVLILGGVFLARNILGKIAIEQGAQQAAGLSIDIGALDLGLERNQLGIKDFRLNNPEGFPDEPMFVAPELFVDYNLNEILKKNIHLNEVRLDLERLAIVKNKDGQLNVNAIKPPQKEDSSEKPSDEAPTDKEKMAIKIDKVTVKIGRVVFKDYTKGDDPQPDVYEIISKKRSLM
jgi:hypothetical protein